MNDVYARPQRAATLALGVLLLSVIASLGAPASAVRTKRTKRPAEFVAVTPRANAVAAAPTGTSSLAPLPTLPLTGGDTGPMAAVAFALLMTGLVLVRVGRPPHEEAECERASAADRVARVCRGSHSWFRRPPRPRRLRRAGSVPPRVDERATRR